jgi:integrase
MPSPTPKYRLHKPSGQAVVTLNGKDHYLGRHNTATSHAEYDRLIAEWLVNGRCLLHVTRAASGLSVNELILAYFRHAEQHYRRPDGSLTDELHCIRSAMRPLKALYGQTESAAFGPLALKAVRQKMVETIGPTGRRWSRRFVNASVGRIKALFKWGVENELVPAAVHQALTTVRGLQEGRSEARETGPVKPVAEALVEPILPLVAPPIRAMIELQLLTGMRPGEVVLLRGLDIDMSGKVWLYRPGSNQGSHGTHKTAWRGRDRVIALGPRAQEIIQAYLKPNLGAYLFSPREAMEAFWAEQRAKRKTKVQASRQNPRRDRRNPRLGERYNVDSYRTAIRRACRKAGVPEWHPHQLRHTKATEIRREAGLDAARAVLGHRSPKITEVYAEIDMTKAAEVMEKLG